jgi:hypothetical protein
MTSRWRKTIQEIRSQIPTDLVDPIAGFLITYLKPGYLNLIAGLRYDACEEPHSLDKQTIMFDPPIERDQVPSPWREMLKENRDDG